MRSTIGMVTCPSEDQWWSIACTNGIEVTALHSHMLMEQPRLFFLHFWANDDALKLAKGLRAALDKTASAKS
jgi:hypothetical protein